jgi:hypothetical protein
MMKTKAQGLLAWLDDAIATAQETMAAWVGSGARAALPAIRVCGQAITYLGALLALVPFLCCLFAYGLYLVIGRFIFHRLHPGEDDRHWYIEYHKNSYSRPELFNKH